ncbi:hypothetical protein ACFSL6_11185 [Paenibacillus thailandensis]|uniref:ISXO2-like transposase domain-containing protein n=1 Tax=Paenibacillus thailandensis TaxID=393250 RepID=A0ABW5QTU3_9BACL
MYLLACSYTNGAVNALQIASILEVTYKTAWSMLRKIRTAVSAYDRQSPLQGNIIAACIQYGFLSGLTNRPQPQVSPVSVCIGQASSSGGYIKIKMIPKEHLLSNRMLPSAKDWIAGQHAAGKANRLHVITQPVYAIEDMKVIRELASSARAWLNAAYHGLGKKYLQSYFDMFCFVYNTKRRSLSAVMQKLASLCVQSAACVIKS